MDMKRGKGITRRILSMLLVLVLYVGMLPVTVFASDTEDTDTGNAQAGTADAGSGTRFPIGIRRRSAVAVADKSVVVTASWAGSYSYLTVADDNAIFDFSKSNGVWYNRNFNSMFLVDISVNDDVPVNGLTLDVSKFGSNVGLVTKIDESALNTSLSSISNVLSYKLDDSDDSSVHFANVESLSAGMHFSFFVPFICETIIGEIPNGTTSHETVSTYLNNSLISVKTLPWSLKSAVKSLSLIINEPRSADGSGQGAAVPYGGYEELYVQDWLPVLETNFGISRSDFKSLIEDHKYGLFCVYSNAAPGSTEAFRFSADFTFSPGTEFVTGCNRTDVSGVTYGFDSDGRLVVNTSCAGKWSNDSGVGIRAADIRTCFLVKCPIADILTGQDTIRFEVHETASITSVATGESVTSETDRIYSGLYGMTVSNGDLYEIVWTGSGYGNSDPLTLEKLYCGVDQSVNYSYSEETIIHNSRRSNFDINADPVFYTHEMMMDFVMINDPTVNEILPLGPGDYCIKYFQFYVNDGLMHYNDEGLRVSYDKTVLP